MADVLLSYRRAKSAHVYVGCISYAHEGDRRVLSIDGLPFHKMIARLSKVLKERPEDRCVFRRVDRPDLSDYVMDEAFTKILREDPLRAVRLMSFEVPMDNEAMVAARDALAQTFGEVVYVERALDKLRCPLCSAWADLAQGRLECFACGNPRTLAVEDVSQSWAGVRVADLLADGAVALFLPRQWNKCGQWIDRTELDKKYEDFLKEVEDVRSSQG